MAILQLPRLVPEAAGEEIPSLKIEENPMMNASLANGLFSFTISVKTNHARLLLLASILALFGRSGPEVNFPQKTRVDAACAGQGQPDARPVHQGTRQKSSTRGEKLVQELRKEYGGRLSAPSEPFREFMPLEEPILWPEPKSNATPRCELRAPKAGWREYVPVNNPESQRPAPALLLEDEPPDRGTTCREALPPK